MQHLVYGNFPDIIITKIDHHRKMIWIVCLSDLTNFYITATLTSDPMKTISCNYQLLLDFPWKRLFLQSIWPLSYKDDNMCLPKDINVVFRHHILFIHDNIAVLNVLKNVWLGFYCLRDVNISTEMYPFVRVDKQLLN